MRVFRGLRFPLVLAIVAASLVAMSGSATATSSASFTTTSDGSAVNANQYASKCEVYINGGPSNAVLPDGNYVFSVLAPSGQSDPNGSGLLSNDSNANRTFTMSGGSMSYSGTHATSVDAQTNATLVQLCLPNAVDQGYATTPNAGGVYILAICPEGNQSPSGCKYDAFKVRSGAVVADDLTAIADVDESYTRTFDYSVDKDVDRTYYAASSGTATFGYVVTLTKSAGVDSNFALNGTVTVFNPNSGTVTGVGVTVDVQGFTDETCQVTNGATSIVGGGNTTFDVACTLPTATATSSGNAVATVTWNQASINSPNASTTATAPYDFSGVSPDLVGNCTEVVDTLDGVATTLAASQCSATTFGYSHEFPLPATGCVTHTNTVVITDGGSDTVTVTVCRTNTGGFTIGYWHNKNGQNRIKNNGTLLCSNLSAYSNVLTLPNPCNGTSLAAYDLTVFNAANSSGDGIAMFRAQFLGTALNASFNNVGNIQVVVPGSLLGTGNCLTVNALLAAANTAFPTLSLNKADLNTVKNVFDAFNNNNALTC